MGRFAQRLMQHMAGAGSHTTCIPTPGLDDCMVTAFMDARGAVAVATVHVGINENEDAVNRFALASFSSFPPTCHRSISFLGYDNDPRGLFDILEVCAKARRLMTDEHGHVRPFVRLLCWSDFDTPTHIVPAAFKAWQRSIGTAAQGGNGFPGILFLAMLSAGIKPRVQMTGTGMRWVTPLCESFEHAVQRDVFGVAGKSQLNAGEIVRVFRRYRRPRGG